MADEWYETIFQTKHPEINEFIQRKQDTGRSPRTLNAYSRVLRKFFHEVYPDKSPAEVTVEDIENYVSILTERGLKRNTKRRYLESISAFYTWAMKRPRFEDVTGDPAAVVLEELPKEVHQRPDCATWDNGKEIIHHIGDPRDKMVAILMAKTGCRVSEALGIELDDLMLDDGFLRLRNRKGGKQTVLPLDGETVTALERYQFIRNADSPYLFVSIRGKRLTRERIRRSVRTAAVEAGVMERGEDRFHKKFTPHTYRTVFTTLMRDRGMPDHILRYLRGDASREVMDVYTKVDREKARSEYVERIKPLEL